MVIHFVLHPDLRRFDIATLARLLAQMRAGGEPFDAGGGLWSLGSDNNVWLKSNGHQDEYFLSFRDGWCRDDVAFATYVLATACANAAAVRGGSRDTLEAAVVIADTSTAKALRANLVLTWEGLQQPPPMEVEKATRDRVPSTCHSLDRLEIEVNDALRASGASQEAFDAFASYVERGRTAREALRAGWVAHVAELLR